MASKKRTLADYGFAIYQSLKRRKVSRTSRMFSHQSDLKEFATYFKALDYCQLTHTLSIPFRINQEIAEFATGKIVQCSTFYTYCEEGRTRTFHRDRRL